MQYMPWQSKRRNVQTWKKDVLCPLFLVLGVQDADIPNCWLLLAPKYRLLTRGVSPFAVVYWDPMHPSFTATQTQDTAAAAAATANATTTNNDDIHRHHNHNHNHKQQPEPTTTTAAAAAATTTTRETERERERGPDRDDKETLRAG